MNNDVESVYFEILDKNIKHEDINSIYGSESYIITMKDIIALLNGHKLYADIFGEYAFTIELDKDTVPAVFEWKINKKGGDKIDN